jgi:lysyl-tRNA synthetase class 2
MSKNGISECRLQTLRQRAFLLSKIRKYFALESVLEVETPILSSAGNTDIHIESFKSNQIKADANTSYLRTSPEFPLKRLLCSGVGDVYELGKVFRKGEVSKTHNVEFTLLEWYRINFNYIQLIQDVTSLFEFIFSSFEFQLPKADIFTFSEVFKHFLNIDVSQISVTQLNFNCNEYGYSGSQLNKDEGLDYLFATQVQPRFDKQCLTFITHYPASQAALAQINPNDPTTALRFEVFYQGLELGNGYQELTDANELSHRFKRDNLFRTDNQMEEIVIDSQMLFAMRQGMPECSGIAIGVDRLLMALLKSDDIAEVLSFSAENS